jgi:hypothetical protein
MRKLLTVDPKWEEKRKNLPGSDLNFLGLLVGLVVYFTDPVLDEIGKLHEAYERCLKGMQLDRRKWRECDPLQWSAWVKGD